MLTTAVLAKHVYFTMKITKNRRMPLVSSEKQGEIDFLIDSITDPIVIFDAEFNIKKLNKAARQFFPGNPVDKKCFATKHKFASACKDCLIWQTLKTGHSTSGEILNFKTGDPILLKTYPIFNNQKKLKGVVLIGRNSSDVPIKWMR